MQNINKRHSVYIAHAIILLFSMIIVLASLFVPVTVKNKQEQESVKLGLPFRFMTQNQTAYDPPFPAKARFYSPWESPPKVNGLNLILSVIVVFAVLDAGMLIVVKLMKEKQERPNVK